MSRFRRIAAFTIPLLLLAASANATSSGQPPEKPSPGKSKLPLSAYKMPNQAVDVPMLDVYTDAGDMTTTRMQAGCEGRARLEAMPNSAQFAELAKKLNLPSKAECANFKRQNNGKSLVKIERQPAVRVPAAPQTPVFTDLMSGQAQQPATTPLVPPAAPPAPAGDFTDDAPAPLNLNP